jgi:hypothetical protein
MTAVDDTLAAGFRSRRESEVNLENNKIGLFRKHGKATI